MNSRGRMRANTLVLLSSMFKDDLWAVFTEQIKVLTKAGYCCSVAYHFSDKEDDGIYITYAKADGSDVAMS